MRAPWASDRLEGFSLSFGIKWARRLGPGAAFLSAALLPIAKLPNPPPNGEVGCELPQREAMLEDPAVLLRMRLPMGPGALLEVSSSCCSGSLSVLRRASQGTSSRPERVAEVGEARLKGFASLVSRRRVPGLVADDGELTPNALAAPCDNDAFRPLMPAVPAPSLFIVGGLTGELMSLVKACGGLALLSCTQAWKTDVSLFKRHWLGSQRGAVSNFIPARARLLRDVVLVALPPCSRATTVHVSRVPPWVKKTGDVRAGPRRLSHGQQLFLVVSRRAQLVGRRMCGLGVDARGLLSAVGRGWILRSLAERRRRRSAKSEGAISRASVASGPARCTS